MNLKNDDEENFLEQKCHFRITRGKLVLTRKSLTFFREKGLFNITYEKDTEILLEEIKECYTNSGAFTGGTMQIIQKNGKETNVTLKGDISAFFVFGLHGILGSEKSKSERLVNAITFAKKGNIPENENPLEFLQLRYVKGEISKAEYVEMKKVLEGEKS